MSWSPTRLLQVHEAPLTSTRPIRVATDAGDAFLKAPGNPEGEQSLAREWIGTRAAKLLGLPVFELAIFSPSVKCRLLCEAAGYEYLGEGDCIAIRYDQGSPWDAAAKTLRRASNSAQVNELIVLDTWIRNRDRFSEGLGVGGEPRCHPDNVWLSWTGPKNPPRIVAMDHTHCLCPEDISATRPTTRDARDPAVYGMFPAFNKLVDLDRVRKLCGRLPEVADQLGSWLDETPLPRSWKVDTSSQSTIKRFLTERADYVALDLPTKLGPPQLNIPLGDDHE